MSEIDNQIEMKLINRFQWRSFKKKFMRMFADDPDITESSRIQRFFMFRIVKKAAENYFCYFDGRKAGLLSLKTKNGSDAFIYGIAVLQEFRRKGLGRYMMNFSERRAKETNKKFMALGVMCSNEPAINLYQKLGFKFVGLGITPISISLDKITTSMNNTIKLAAISECTDEVKDLFKEIILNQIRTVSQNDGVDYVRENRLDAYLKYISNYIKKADFPFHQIIDSDIPVGFIFYRAAKTTLRCSLYLQLEKYSEKLLLKLAEKIKKELKNEKKFETLKFRLSLHEANKLVDVQKKGLERDSSLDKYLMFKKT